MTENNIDIILVKGGKEIWFVSSSVLEKKRKASWRKNESEGGRNATLWNEKSTLKEGKHTVDF